MADSGFKKMLDTRWSRITLIVVMAGIIVITLSPVLNNGFLTNWDDQWMVTGNPYLQDDGYSTILVMFTEPYGGQYSPVNTLAYVMIVKIGGMEPFGFQLFFLVIHILNFLLVGLVIDKLLQLIRGVDLTESLRCAIAWGTAFMFAIHPMQVEAVAWISASKVVLYSIFYLLGLWFYLVYIQAGKRFYLVLVLLCFLASLLSKEQAVVFVATLMLVDLVVHPVPKQKQIWLEKIPFVLVALFFSLFTLSIQGSPGVGGSYPFGNRVLFANYSFWEYIIKLTAPHSLSHFYFFPVDPGEPVPFRFWFYPLATGVFLWILYEYRRHINKVYLFGGLFFLINIALMLHILPTPRATIIADRYVYLSAVGFFLVIVYALSLYFVNHTGYLRILAMAVCGFFLIYWAVYAHDRSKAWENMETLNESVRPVIEKHMGEFNWPGQ